MSPDGGGEPDGELAKAIADTFESLDELKAADEGRRAQALRQRLVVARARRDRPRRALDPEPGHAR